MIFLSVSETLVPLGITVTQLRAPLKPLGPSHHYCVRGLRKALNWVPIMKKKSLEKTAAITRVAVREACASRHHGGPIEGPWKPMLIYIC